jgi:nicotinic acid mononucleotide adenylyltransferase
MIFNNIITEKKGCTMTREDLLTTYHQYKKNYLEVMGWDMKETFEEWLQRMEDIDSFLIQDNL